MGPESVVLLPPPFDDHLGLSKSIENLPVEHLISLFSIERFVVSVLPGAAWLNEQVWTPIRHKIIGPDMVAMRRSETDTGALIEPQTSPFGLFLGDL